MPDRPPLPRDEVRRAVERRGPCRVPMTIHQWNGAATFGDRADDVRALHTAYPEDVYTAIPRMPAFWDDPAAEGAIPGYAWLNVPPPAADPDHPVALDANVAIRDWSQLDAILDAFPDANEPAMLAGLAERMARDARGRYTVSHWWFGLYERLWSLRGMENILCDFHTDPEPVHRLMDALTDFYCAVIRRSGAELGVDGIYTTDDIGMQTGTMFGPDIFHEFFRPRYRRMIDAAHEQGMQFWLHTCGNVERFLDDFVELGLDVIHPIQKYTMDERAIAARHGGRITFWTGMDVQQILPRGTPDDVRAEVRFMIDTFDGPDGGCMVTAGNAITADVPIENLRAFYDEAYRYGLEHRARIR